MAKGSFTAGSSSAEVIAASEYRDTLLIQKTNATTIALGIGEAAEAGKGIQLVNVGDTARLRGPMARSAIYAIGNNGTGAYQDGNCDVRPGPHVP